MPKRRESKKAPPKRRESKKAPPKYWIRNSLPLWKYSLRIRHSGQKLWNEKKSYEYYAGGEEIWVDNLDPEDSSLKLFKEIVAKHLGYENPEFSYRRLGDERITELDDRQLKEVIGKMLEAGTQEIEVYVSGHRKIAEVENNPKILYWNCRGVNDPTVDMLRALVDIYNPDIVLLIETRLSSKFITNISSDLGFQSCRDSPANRHMEDQDNCVGLAALWKQSVKLRFYDRSENYLDFTVNGKWRLTLFYGHPNYKDLSWEWLEALSKKSPNKKGEWIIIADFNEILDSKEKIGGREKRCKDMKLFREALKTCQLDDLLFKGDNIFTWIGNNGIRERLDRGVANKAWKTLFPHYRVLHLTNGILSDHIPLLVETDSQKQRLEATKTLCSTMKDFLRFVGTVEVNYPQAVIPTTQALGTSEFKDLYYDIARHVAPHLFQLKYIAVHNKNTNEVTYERIVTLMTRHNLRASLLNRMVFYKPSWEYDFENSIDFPSVSCETNQTILNYSEYIAQAMKLIKLIPPDGNISRGLLVQQRIDSQVENLIQWATQVSDGGDYSNIKAKLEKKEHDAVIIGRAINLYNTIASLIKDDETTCEGTVSELQATLWNYYPLIFPKNCSDKDIEAPLQFLLETFHWHHSNNDDSRYEITLDHDDEQRLIDLEKKMLREEGEAAMINDPRVKMIMENGMEKEKLLKCFAEKEEKWKTITEQLELLERIRCISFLKDKENISLSREDNNIESICSRLEKSLCEALKKLKMNKSMSREDFLKRLKEAYRKSKNVTKKKVEGTVGKKSQNKKVTKKKVERTVGTKSNNR